MNYNLEKLRKNLCLSKRGVLYYIQQRISDKITEYEKLYDVKLSIEDQNYLRGVLTEKLFE